VHCNFSAEEEGGGPTTITVIMCILRGYGACIYDEWNELLKCVGTRWGWFLGDGEEDVIGCSEGRERQMWGSMYKACTPLHFVN
jgi:hypothetical protein